MANIRKRKGLGIAPYCLCVQRLRILRGIMTTAHTLYTLAEQADARLSEVLKSRTGRTRWTMKADDYKIPEVAEALRAKFNADEAWLTYLRTSRENRNV